MNKPPYRKNAVPSSGLAAQMASAECAATVIRRACDDIRTQPSTLGIWGFRLAQWIARGRFDYRQTWRRIEAAAVEGGAGEAWARRTLYRAFADSMTLPVEPMPLTVLAGSLH